MANQPFGCTIQNAPARKQRGSGDRVLNESKIRNFLYLSNKKSIVKAAEELYITQQALSKQIALLEQDIGVTLFTRTNKGISLTENGKICYDMFDRFIREYDGCRKKFRESVSASIVNIGAQSWIEIGKPMRNVVKSLDEKTVVNLGCYPIDTLVDCLHAGEVDIAIMLERFIPNEDDSLESCPLAETPMGLLMPRDYPGAEEATSYMDFRNEPYLGFPLKNEEAFETLARLKIMLSEYGMSPEAVKITLNSESVSSEMEIGHGVCMMPLMFNRTIRNPRIKVFPTGVNKRLMCIWRRNDATEDLKQFIELLCAECQKPEYREEVGF